VSPIDGAKSTDPGLKGEVCIRGPQLMLGYRNRDEETTLALRDGWLYTGDIGEFDSEGYLYITDRVKDMIIVSGYNVYPREIEDLLYKYDSILEAAVVGVTDPYRGEIVKAYIAAVQGSNLQIRDLEVYCKKHLAKYKVPSHFEIISELPKTIVGKIDKIALRKRNNDQIQ
jgi:long-chain acyl-CoA synthetase